MPKNDDQNHPLNDPGLAQSLAMIEAMNGMVNFLATVRDELMDKGWSGPGAEQAAITLMGVGMQTNAAQGGGSRG